MFWQPLHSVGRLQSYTAGLPTSPFSSLLRLHKTDEYYYILLYYFNHRPGSPAKHYEIASYEKIIVPLGLGDSACGSF